MRFTQLLTNLILEQSRFQVLYDKMVKPAPGREGDARKPKGLMDFETLKAIIFADPTTKKPQNFDESDVTVENLSRVQPGAYTNWLLKTYITPGTFNDERDDVQPGTPEYKKMVQEYRDLFMEDLFIQ